MYIDLHTHSYPASDDSFVSADDLIEGAKRAGLDGICLTDHDHFWVAEDVELLAKRHNFLVLAGAEINTDDGHVLVFGLHQYQFGMHKPAFLHQRVQEAGGVMVAAHPYRRRFPKSRPPSSQQMDEALQQAASEALFASCNAIEVVNGRGKSEENLFSQSLCESLGIAGTGGSDVHRAEHIGRACTRFHHKISSLSDLVRELASGACSAVSGQTA